MSPRIAPAGPWVLAVLSGALWGYSLDHGSLVVMLAWITALAALLTSGAYPRLITMVGVAVVAATSAGILAGALRLSAGAGWDPAVDGALLAATNAAGMLALLLAGVAAIRVVLRHRAHRRRGWRLADAVAAEHAATLRASLAEERTTMAGEIHDGIGHRLAYTALAVGRLSTDPELDPQAQSMLERVHEDLADITDELGETVALLRRGDTSRRPAARPLTQVMEEIRAGGVQVEASGLEHAEGASSHAVGALARVLEETGANAAEHASGAPLAAVLRHTGSELELTVSCDPGTAVPPVPRPGAQGLSEATGLQSLRRRVQLLGGTMTHTPVADAGATDFVVRARLAVEAVPLPAGALPPADVAAERVRSRQEVSRGLGRTVLAVTVLLLAGLVAVTALSTLRVQLGVLPPHQYAELEVGQDREEVLALLPPVQMLEPPRQADPVQWDCRYYEATVSRFERDDVFRICLDDHELVHMERIPAP